MKKAIFLDRDGTIIQYVSLLIKPEEIRVLPKVAKAIKDFKNLGFLNIVVTNQPIVARGLIDPKGIDNLHRVLSDQISGMGAGIDYFYFCPHHPEANVLKYRK